MMQKLAQAQIGNRGGSDLCADRATHFVESLYEIARADGSVSQEEIDEIKSVPYAPASHPFVERLIGSIRREYLDQTLFWNSRDLERKLASYGDYFNDSRVHSSLGGRTPAEVSGAQGKQQADATHYDWQSHCGGLYTLPVAA